MLQYGWYFDSSKDFIGMKFWQMSIYVHLCCSMGDILIIQKILVGWTFEKFHLCPFMLQYGWYFDNSKDFIGMNFWQMSIYIHLCCSMGDILIVQKDFSGMKFWQISIYVHLCCNMGDIFRIQKNFSGMKIWKISIYAVIWVKF